MVEHWFRISEIYYAAPLDEWENPIGEGSVGIHIEKYPVLKHTPKGVRIYIGGEQETRFILKEARKRWACPTIEEAYVSFYARKAKQISIMQARIRGVETAIVAAKKSQKAGEPRTAQHYEVSIARMHQ